MKKLGCILFLGQVIYPFQAWPRVSACQKEDSTLISRSCTNLRELTVLAKVF